MALLSIVVPCYNEEETVDLFFEALMKVLRTMDLKYEVIFVNDGSKDSTLEKMVRLYHANPGVV